MSAHWKVGAASGDIIDATTGETIACEPPMESEADEARWATNAPVLAAARDMLKAIERVGCQDRGSCGPNEPDGRCFVCSALARARGER